MNNNLEFENEGPTPDNIEDNHPRTNYGEGYYEEPKQETLEDAVEIHHNTFTRDLSFAETRRESFIEGANWQAKQEKNASIRLEKHNVCVDCYSLGISYNDCVCTYQNNYPTIELEFEVCGCCGNVVEDGSPADTQFNRDQLK